VRCGRSCDCPGRLTSGRTGLLTVLACAVLVPAASASAATFQVTNTNDPGTGTCEPGNCSLRDAINAANADATHDTVLVPPGTYELNAGKLAIVDAAGMSLIGTGGAAATVIDGQHASEILKINGAPASVTISGLTLTNGQGPEGSAISAHPFELVLEGDVFSRDSTGAPGTVGAGAVSYETGGKRVLRVANSEFLEDEAGSEGTTAGSSGQGNGGGIYFAATEGSLTVTGSTFTQDSAGGRGGEGISSGQGDGGAIYVEGNLTASISGSSFVSDHAGGEGGSGTSSGQGGGGAIGFSGTEPPATLAVTGSTFSGDRAGGPVVGPSTGEGFGGAIEAFDKGALTLANDTLTGNSVGAPLGAGSGAGGAGGALYTNLSANLVNDTLDGNAVIGPGAGGNLATSQPVTLENTIVSGGAGEHGANCSGPVSSVGHNIESTTPSQCGLSSATGDLVGVNPLLDVLALNGGATETQALFPGSPAINAGEAVGCPATDQRGEPRPQGPACDIGAYESAPPSATTGAASGVGTSGATLAGSGANPELLPGHTYFQWGTTTSYGSQTTPETIAAGGVGSFSAALSGLVPGTLYHFRAVVANIDGASYGADTTFLTGVFQLQLTKPIVSSLSETDSVFAVSSRSTALHGVASRRHHKGTVFAFTLNQAATVRIAIQALLLGRRAHGACRAPSHKLRHKPRCTRTHTLITLVRTGHAGRDLVAFTGRPAGKALAPGHYRIVVTAADAAGTSAPRYLAFTIVAR
jgi:CSLREA domain-containing protein